jgi:CDP-4-dehydro-6-deoxyglucose reductase
MPKTHTLKVVSNEEIIHEVRVLKVTLDEPTSFSAGQYFSFKVADKANRSYSIASKPSQNPMEFLIEIIPGGLGSTFVLNLKVGDEFQVIGPLGFFNLDKTNALADEKPLLFIATGTGIAPMRSMIKHLLEDLNSQREMHLYFGMRFEDKTYYFEEFAELAEKYPNFKFTPVISRPTEKWSGATGHVQDHIKQIPVIPNAKVYLCGSNTAVQSIIQDLIEYGYPKEMIFFEKFG